MMAVYMFDCDGTLWAGNGPVTKEMVDRLIWQGNKVVIVSESGSCVNLPYERSVAGTDRSVNIRQAMAKYPEEIYVYISDNSGDDQRAKDLGISYIHPRDFIVPGEHL